MNTRKYMNAVALMAMLTFSATAMASGSDAGGGAETGDAQANNMGKGVYASKLACPSCPKAGAALNAELAEELLSGKGLPALRDDEKHALTVYLKRRFKL